MKQAAITSKTLDLAALAAGMTPVRMSDDGRALLVADQAEPWRPHTDIAEAARLAVGLDISVDIDGSTAFAHVDGYEDMDDCGYGSAEHDGTEPDKLRAWCEAVTLCAATIGLRMKENER